MQAETFALIKMYSASRLGYTLYIQCAPKLLHLW